MHGLTSSQGGIVYVFWDYSPTRIQNQIQLTFFCVAGTYWPLSQHTATQVTLTELIPRLSWGWSPVWPERLQELEWQIYIIPDKKKNCTTYPKVWSWLGSNANTYCFLSFICLSRRLYLRGIPVCGRCTHSFWYYFISFSTLLPESGSCVCL